MPQELKGLFTILCTACRFRAPVFVGNKRQWNCPHRHATVMEMNDRHIETTEERCLNRTER